MHEALTTGTIITITAVIVFVLFLIMLVIVLDHKARIPGALRKDAFQITGSREDHPVWSYIIGSFLLIIICSVAVELSATLLNYIPINTKENQSVLLTNLKKKSVLENARHFHNPANSLMLDGKKSVCYYCHGDFPHFQKRMIRTLLNMHTQFLGCMTCHADPEKAPEHSINLRWLNYSGISVSGNHFGIDYDNETGFLQRTDDYYSKIVPYFNDMGKETLLEIVEDDPMAVDFVNVQEKLKGQEREAVKKSLHKMVRAKGRFCTRCHTQKDNGFVPFAELGFSERRINELTNLNIIGLVEKYKEFYMPNLLEIKVNPIRFNDKLMQNNSSDEIDGMESKKEIKK